ncbi:hypothetical protein N8603_03080 [Verrucomicrobiales bacterium]|nr:hypothetical protein [Verrucomicrobiales bacterium]
MKLFSLIQILILFFSINDLLAGVFLAEATDNAKTPSRAKLHYGENIKILGKTNAVYELSGKQFVKKFNMLQVISVAEGFVYNKHRKKNSITDLEKNKRNLISFSKKFPKSKDLVLKEISIINSAIQGLNSNKAYDRKSGLWIEQKIDKTLIIGEIIIDDQRYNVTKAIISDYNKKLITLIHDQGLLKKHISQLPEKVLSFISVETKKEKEFVDQSLALKKLNNFSLIGDKLFIESVEIFDPLSTKIKLIHSEGYVEAWADSFSSEILGMIKALMKPNNEKFFQTVSTLKKMPKSDRTLYKEKELLIEEIKLLLTYKGQLTGDDQILSSGPLTIPSGFGAQSASMTLGQGSLQSIEYLNSLNQNIFEIEIFGKKEKLKSNLRNNSKEDLEKIKSWIAINYIYNKQE